MSRTFLCAGIFPVLLAAPRALAQEPGPSASASPAESANEAPSAAAPAGADAPPTGSEGGGPPPLSGPAAGASSSGPPPLSGPAAAPERSREAGASRVRSGDQAEELDTFAVEENGESPRRTSPVTLRASWDLSDPLGDSADFVSGLGVQSFSVEVDYWATGHLALGLSLGWHNLSSRRNGSFTVGDVTYTGLGLYELNENPIFLKASWAFLDRRRALDEVRDRHPGTPLRVRLVPWVAFGAGPARSTRRIDVGVVRFANETWAMGLAPELGLEAPLGPVTPFVAARLISALPSGDAPGELYATLRLGATFE